MKQAQGGLPPQASDYRLLHLSCHGVFDPDSSLQSVWNYAIDMPSGRLFSRCHYVRVPPSGKHYHFITEEYMIKL